MITTFSESTEIDEYVLSDKKLYYNTHNFMISMNELINPIPLFSLVGMKSAVNLNWLISTNGQSKHNN